MKGTIAAAGLVWLSATGVGAQTEPTRPASKPAAKKKAASGPKFRLILNAVFSPIATDYEENRTVPLYAEDSTIESSYKAKTGTGGSAGLGFSLTDSVGIVATFGLLSRGSSDEIHAQLPHPLFLGRSRLADHSLSGLSHKELYGHLSLAYRSSGDKLEYSLFAGPSFFRVEADLVDDLTLEEEYPYDSVTITGAKTVSAKKSAIGFHAGAGVDYLLGDSFALGLEARYAIASAALKANEDAASTKISAGGLQVGAGLRLRF